MTMIRIPTAYLVPVPGLSMPRCVRMPSVRSSTTQVFTPSQPIVISSCAVAGRYAPRRPNAARESVIWLTPVRAPMTQNAPKIEQPTRLPITSTRSVSTRLSPRMIPSAPSTQLIGAMFAPAQIQNCCSGVESRSAAGTGAIPCVSSRTSAACSAVAMPVPPGGRRDSVGAIMRPRPAVRPAPGRRNYAARVPLVLRNGLVDLGGGRFERADVGIEAGRVATVGARDDSAQGEVLDCSRFAVVPGMVDAHAHSNENWFRGMWDNLPLEPWMLFSYPVLAAPSQSADEIYLRTLLGGIELLRSGATTVVDFLYDDEQALEPVVRAYRDLGLRALIAIGMGDRAYHETVVLDERLVSRSLIDRLEREKPPSWDEWAETTRRAVERFHRPDDGITICPAPSGPQRCTDEMLAGCAALADELDLMIHIHVLETRMQALSGRRMYGRTLPEHMDALGFLSPRVCFEHGIWLTPSDIELVRDRGVTVVHNPVSNMKLGSGIAPVPEPLRGGVNVALGTDGMCSNDGNDMFAALKTAALLHKLWDVDYEQWLGATEAWQIATAGGATAAGDPEGLGSLEPGRRADLVLLDLDSIVFTPLNDPLKQVALGSTTLAVSSVMVGGEWRVRDGRVTGVDEAAVLAEGRERGAEIVARHDEGFQIGQELLASLRAGWLAAMRTSVGVERKLAP